MEDIPNTTEFIQAMVADEEIQALRLKLFTAVAKYRYTYNFNWLGRPIIQMPQDIVAMQELIWRVRPDFIIECGVAHGGSLILYASILELIANDGLVLGIDIEIREHNLLALKNHPLYHRVKLINGSSIDPVVVEQARLLAEGRKNIMVVLDSDHTHEHVLEELKCYSPLVTKGSYLVVFDTLIEEMPEGSYPDRRWGKGNNPMTGVGEFLKGNKRFIVDEDLENRFFFTVAPKGYLKCIKD
ncbi:MAG: cephalosporin hydroxylase family protein [Desulfobacterales bacterium]|nr:cephalosporin hydroxylase family protein [Desulfobacterales bacterium]